MVGIWVAAAVVRVASSHQWAMQLPPEHQSRLRLVVEDLLEQLLLVKVDKVQILFLEPLLQLAEDTGKAVKVTQGQVVQVGLAAAVERQPLALLAREAPRLLAKGTLAETAEQITLATALAAVVVVRVRLEQATAQEHRVMVGMVCPHPFLEQVQLTLVAVVAEPIRHLLELAEQVAVALVVPTMVLQIQVAVAVDQ